MADEPKTDGATTEPKDGGKVVFDSQEDFDAVIQRRVKKLQAELEDAAKDRAELAKLREADQKRKEAELTEMEKFKKQLEEKDKVLMELQKDREFRQSWEEKETAEVEKMMEELTDDQKSLVNKLPLMDRRSAVMQFASNTNSNVNISKGAMPMNKMAQYQAEIKDAKTASEVEAVLHRWAGRI